MWPPGTWPRAPPSSPVLQQCGPAPALAGISRWLNTPGDRPLTLAGLRGRVVLVDFWTYSCINCQRTLPHLEAWNRAYAADGLTIIGVHTPEFAFEHVTANVAQASRQLGVVYPVAQDNDYTTWNAYENNYWPAEYLVDATGTIRHVDFGEGEYGQTESFIRQLLVAAHPAVHLPGRTDVANLTPDQATTPESYLGYQHGTPNLAGQTVVEDRMSPYQVPSTVPADEYAYGGNWSVGPRGIDGRGRGQPVPPIRGQRRLLGARWLRHRTGLAGRPTDPDGDGGRRAQALPAGWLVPQPAGATHPGRVPGGAGLRLHLRLARRRLGQPCARRRRRHGR